MDDIKLIPTDDLIAELLLRHYHAVFMGVKVPWENKDKVGEIRSVRRWKGNSYTCSGMCNSLSQSILSEFGKGEEIIPKEDF